MPRGYGEEATTSGQKTSLWVRGFFIGLAVLFMASGVYALVQREDDWVWDVVKGFVAAACVLVAGIGPWGRRRRDASVDR